MKFGKEFQHLLEASDFPDDWKHSAIEYGKLKKLIKNVVAELEGMGLPPEVLHKLLVTEQGAAAATVAGAPAQPAAPAPAAIQELDDNDDMFEFEFESTSLSPEVGKTHKHSPKEVLLDPVFDDDGEDEEEVAGSVPNGGSLAPRKFRLRLVSDADGGGLGTTPPARPMSVTGMLRTMSESDTRIPTFNDEAAASPPTHRIIKRAEGVKAEYVLAGDEKNPVPQIRLHVAHLEVGSGANTPDRSDSTPLYTTDTDTDEESDAFAGLEEAMSPSTLKTPRAAGIPPSPTLKHMRAIASPIFALASGANLQDGMGKLSLGEAMGPSDVDVEVGGADTPVGPARATIHELASTESLTPSLAGPSTRGAPAESPPLSSSEREFIIPLHSDEAFFNVLTAALRSLSEFHKEQQEQFRKATAALCGMISASIQPGDGVMVLPTPLNSSPVDGLVKYEYHSAAPSQKDLYAWREIFSLWIESEIFESQAERDRGERSVDEAERRLKIFANEVVKRGLGDRRSIKGKRSRKAWDEFLRLNVLLLDLKRFQTANIDAARKILKKHDKRTALTASTGLSAFVRQTLSAHITADGNVTTWVFYNTSLPHVLLASLTDTLLPILPSLDDYACLICMSIAFKPIRLTCGHLFCVRCLVKMQQRSKENCPLCRAPSVLLADKSCLDTALMNFMKDWFPREVKAKQRENSDEIAKESVESAGMDHRCVVM
ncbi:hypothetical protein Q8F55_007182 [Vanrija albida]|uniref:RING-type domain-containing protein n=1 Tax=Vanrija albida TaxID=181172 RepID=A0ABR3Q047_9TREE